ncbi:MAG: endonuclease/exonuclease/phosphatase family protein [Planctomycetes bacterium]|nr:endonuclease/exonuclease/phosphatase family protein [Planctomycetota bacterium]
MGNSETTNATLSQSSPANPGTPTRGKIWNYVLSRGVFLGYGILIATIVGFLGGINGYFDIFSHFRFAYAYLLALFTVLALIHRRRKTAMLFGGAMIFHFVSILSFLSPSPATATETPSGDETNPKAELKVLCVNVHSSNERKEDVLKLLRDEKPDLACLIETTRAWCKSIETIAPEFSYFAKMPRDDNVGIAFLSAIKPDKCEILADSAMTPTIWCELTVGGRKVVFVGLHAVPPIFAGGFEWQNNHLAEVSERLAKVGKDVHVIVCGDFNATPWSITYERFVTSTGLLDARRGFGLEPTWPAGFTAFGIPIDHIFVSENVGVRNFRLGRDIGSDHLPLLVDLSLR